jgi:hypothetical protein
VKPARSTSPDGLAGLRYFEISVQRWCGEFVCGRVTREFHDYWKSRSRDELAEYINSFDPEDRDPAAPPALETGETPDGWYEIDDVAHINNAVTNGNSIFVTEVVPDEDSHTGFRPLADGYDETFVIEDIAGDMPETFLQCERDIEIDTEADAPANPVFVGKSIEKGAQTIGVCATEGDFDIRKLSIHYWSFDGDDVIRELRYDGTPLENWPDSSDGKALYFYVGDLHESSDGEDQAPSEDAAETDKPAPAPPGRFRLFIYSLWPSFAHTLKSILSVIGFPVFLLASLSAVKYLAIWNVLEIGGVLAQLIAWQQFWLDYASDYIAGYGIHVPPVIIDAALVYLSVGNTVARSEKQELLSVHGVGSERWALLGEFFTRGRIDSLTYAVPRFMRGGFIRISWPLIVLYRLGTPFVVEGPGPDGSPISSAVPRRELADFAAMVTSAHGTWKGQSVKDFRQIVVWHFALVALGAWLTGQALALLT